MTQPTKIWLSGAGVLAAFLAVAGATASALKLVGRDLAILWAGLAVLGAACAAIVVWFLKQRTPTAPVSGVAGDVDSLLQTARARLAASRGKKDSALGGLPLLLVLGPTGSTKTTAVIRSGLEAELLAGEATRGDTTTPTRHVNLWFAQNTIVAEAGGPMLASDDGWKHLVRALRADSVMSAMTGKPQAPRYALVCFGCDELVKPGAGEAVAVAARALRARLGEAAGAFGIRLPVYVLFTRADAIPHFEAYVRNLSAEEAREPLGAALAPDVADGRTYAERATPRLELAMQELYRSLARRRLPVLAREHAPEWKPGAYEFPREIRKLAPVVVDFLREIGKPSELEANPLLRGFYFTGVQAVFVSDGAQEYAAPAAAVPAARAAATARSATGVFSPEQIAAAAASMPTPAVGQPRTRKVPRWDFLPRVFKDVVLADDAATQLTQGGERVGFWRRAALATAAGVALLLSTAFAVSYGRNRALVRETTDSAREFASIAPNNVDLPPVDALRRLDALRARLDTLSIYEHDGAPLSMRWGLYSGSALYPDVRRAYFAGFDRLLFANTRNGMLATLRGLPDAPRPTDDYGDSYGLLKGYLITTTHPEKSTVEFLSPVLMKQWLAGRIVDPERSQLAQRQFDTYARELRFDNPYALQADPAAVARGRTFLRQFAGSERIYQFMLAEAAKTNPAVQFNRRYPGSAQYLVASYEVPGAFTTGGFAFMQGAFKTVDRFLQGESWVVGEDAQPVDKAKLVADLRTRYTSDYVDHWRRYLRTANVARYGSVRDAAQKLTVLSGNQSPLLELFSLASRNTAVPAPEIAGVFQPVQTVVPPNDTAKLIGQTNQPYMSALVGLQAALQQAAAAQGPAGEAAAGQAAGQAATAKTAARTIAASFTIDPVGQVQSTVQNLMEAPIAYAEPLLTRFGADQINMRTRAFCSAARSTFAKLPFNSSSTVQASIQEVSAILRPGTGSLWTMYNDVLQNALQKQGTAYAPVGGNVRLSPTFVTFFNRAATLSDALFPNGAQEPHLSLMVQPQLTEGTSSVSVTLEGDVMRATRNSLQTSRVDWPATNHDARLTAQLGNSPEITIVGPYGGPWAMFQLFADADGWQPSGNAARAEWTARTRNQVMTLPNGAPLKVSVNVTPASTAAVLRRGYFSGAECTLEAAR